MGCGILQWLVRKDFLERVECLTAHAAAVCDHAIGQVKDAFRTEAINKHSYRFPFQPDDIVLVALFDHHNNDLPW